MHSERYRPSVDLEGDGQLPAQIHPSERMDVDTDNADFYPPRSGVPPTDALTNYSLRAKSFAEQEAVLSLRRLSERDESSSSRILGPTIDELTNALVADAPAAVAQAIQRDEVAALTHLQDLIKKRIAIVSRGLPVAEVNGTRPSEAPTDIDESIDGIS